MTTMTPITRISFSSLPVNSAPLAYTNTYIQEKRKKRRARGKEEFDVFSAEEYEKSICVQS